MLEIYVIDSVKVIGNKRVIKRFPQGSGGWGYPAFWEKKRRIRPEKWDCRTGNRK
jgi:hypothetical protein